jgi:hypothetical protein
MEYENFTFDNDYDTSVEQFKKLDKNFFSYNKKVCNNNNRIKNIKIGLYASGGMGSQIRNAETGVYYKDIVGSSNEDLYCKVIDATGRFSKGPVTFFYASQSQYKSHNQIL